MGDFTFDPSSIDPSIDPGSTLGNAYFTEPSQDTSLGTTDFPTITDTSGGFTPLQQGGSGGCDPTDPNGGCYDPTLVASYGGLGDPSADPAISGYNANLDVATVNWCEANPGACDTNGPTTAFLDQFCNDVPSDCVEQPDGTTTTSTGGPSRSTSSGGGSGGGTGGGSAGGGSRGSGSSGQSSSNPLASLLSQLAGGFQTCPPGFVKVSNGQCIRSGYQPSYYNQYGGLQSGFLGTGISTTVIILIVLVLLILHKSRG